MRANFGGRRSCDSDLGTLNPRKKCQFLCRKFGLSQITKKWLNMECCNLDTTWLDVEGASIPSLRAPGHVTEIYKAENRQKVENFEVVYLG